MTEAGKNLATRSECAGVPAINRREDRQITWGYHQQRVLNLLSDGIPRSVADISAALRMSDPRSAICDIRAYRLPMNGARACTGAGSNGILFGKEGCNNVKEKQ